MSNIGLGNAEQIDHAASAQRLLDIIGVAVDELTGGLPVDSVARCAQVHATLAVAHELRTANLITFASHLAFATSDADAEFDNAVADARARLGLRGESDGE